MDQTIFQLSQASQTRKVDAKGYEALYADSIATRMDLSEMAENSSLNSQPDQ